MNNSLGIAKVLAALIVSMLVITLAVVVAMLIFADHGDSSTVPAHHVAASASYAQRGHGHH